MRIRIVIYAQIATLYILYSNTTIRVHFCMCKLLWTPYILYTHRTQPQGLYHNACLVQWYPSLTLHRSGFCVVCLYYINPIASILSFIPAITLHQCLQPRLCYTAVILTLHRPRHVCQHAFLNFKKVPRIRLAHTVTSCPLSTTALYYTCSLPVYSIIFSYTSIACTRAIQLSILSIIIRIITSLSNINIPSMIRLELPHASTFPITQ